MNRLFIACAACAAGITAFGALTEFTDIETASLSKTGDGVKATTAKLVDWPSDIPTPIFWFDCNVTNGWETEVTDGVTYVTKIPSLVGDRFLTTDMTLDGMVWKGWGSTKPKPPMLVKYDDLAGGPVLDLGKWGSRRAMSFDPVSYDGGATTNNVMKNIGALIGLWGSQEGGGYILGGGDTADNQNAWCYDWVRGWDNWTGAISGTVKWWTTVTGSYGGGKSNNPGYWAHDGWFSSANRTGLNGGWEVIGMSMNAATWSATGVGIGDARTGYARDGGQRIGELMIFDQTLTRDQMARAQVWMRTKWFGKGSRGWNGDANIGTIKIATASTVRGIVDVPEDEIVTVQRLEGGRFGGYTTTPTAVVKAGAGTLAVNEAATFAAPVELAGGTLKIPAKKTGKIATAADLPYGLYIHFDVSATDSLTLSDPDDNGVRYLEKMENLGTGMYQNNPIFTQVNRGYTTSDKLRPIYVANAYGTGKPMLNFGPRLNGTQQGKKTNEPGRYLCFHYRKTSDGTETMLGGISGIGTVVAVVNAEYGGGHLGNGPLARGDRWPSLYTTKLLGSTVIANANLTTDDRDVSAVYIDGQRLDKSSGFPHRGTHVVAYQLQPGEINAIGAEQYYTEGETSASGGVILGEILYFARTLTSEELLEVQEYLSKKWLGRDIPGYGATTVAKAAPDVQDLRVTGASKIDVPEGATAKLGALKTDAPLVKTGTGTLIVAPGSDASQLTVAEGDVQVAAVDPKVAESEKCQMAAGASYHLDASDLGNFWLETVNGTNFVKSWYSRDGIPAYQDTAKYRPWINSDADALLNGKSVVDFGPYSAYDGTVAGACALRFSKSFDGVRSVFIVRGTQAGGGAFLGETSGVTDWCRSGDFVATLERPIAGSASAPVSKGRFYQDGVLTNITVALPTGTYEINDVHTLAGTHVSALALYKNAYMWGGQRIAEVIIYERPLTDREIVATRNYLTQKWFPNRALQDLPDEPTPTAVTKISDIALTEGVTVAADLPIAVTRVTGDAALTKTGAGQLTVCELDGRVDVTEGSLKLDPLPVDAAAGAVPAEGRILHLDATQGLVTETNDLGVSVWKWNSLAGNGWTAVAGEKESSTVTNPPTLLAEGLNGLPIVKMSNYGSGVYQYMRFAKDGVPTLLTGIRSAFWVIGSQEGGGFMLGGGYNEESDVTYVWHRGGSGEPIGSRASDGMIAGGNSQKELRETAWWTINGATQSYGHGLSGDYDVVSMVMASNAVYAASADGLAFDGRNGFSDRTGRQRLGELIIYDRPLTPDEANGVITYLRRKWGFTVAETSTNAVVNLAAGTTLDVADGQYVKSVGGDGTVNGGVTAGGFIADAANETGLTVGGTLTVAANPAFALENLPADIGNGVTVKVATATGYAGLENLANATFTGLPAKCRAKAKIEEGALVVTVRPIRGLVFILE